MSSKKIIAGSPAATIVRRLNMSKDYRDESKEVPDSEHVCKQGNIDQAIDWIQKNGDTKYIYRIFINNKVNAEYAHSVKSGWHKLNKQYCDSHCAYYCCVQRKDRYRDSKQLDKIELH